MTSQRKDRGRYGRRHEAEPLAETRCELHLPSAQPDIEDIGMRWAIAWYRNTQSRTRLGESHVAA